MPRLLNEIRDCTICKEHLPLEPRPILSFSTQSRIMIIGQAPGIKAHESSTPWNDPSGVRLRDWMNIDDSTFYDPKKIALVPCGFCYPGKGKGGDLPPRPECAATWHDRIWKSLKNVRLTLLIGKYAHNFYLKDRQKKTLTETVRSFREYAKEGWIPLPHPSPRNLLWLKKNPWFEKDVVPYLRRKVSQALK